MTRQIIGIDFAYGNSWSDNYGRLEQQMEHDEGLLTGLKELFLSVIQNGSILKLRGQLNIACIDCWDGYYVNGLNEFAEEIKKKRELIRQDSNSSVKDKIFAESNYIFHCHGYGVNIQESLSVYGPSKPKPLFNRSLETGTFPIYDYVICLDTMCNMSHQFQFSSLAKLINMFGDKLILVWGKEGNTKLPEEIKHLFHSVRIYSEDLIERKLRDTCKNEYYKNNLLVFKKCWT